MRQIRKWDVGVDGNYHEIGGGQVLHAFPQYGAHAQFQVWTLDEGDETRTVMAYPTGDHVPDEANYLATVVTAAGSLVWHLFEEPTP